MYLFIVGALLGAGGPETLPVCGKCLNPRVVGKSGVGTAAAVADAKVVADDAAPWCAMNRPRDPACVRYEVQQGGDGARDSFRATANCATGELHSMRGDDFVYAGVWEEGAGKGRPKFRQPPQNNVPQWESIRSGYGKSRDEWDRFGGYSLAGQWEVLCGKTAPQVASAPVKAGPVARAAAAPAAAEKEWLSLCSRCDNPVVFAKSGIGTANAVAQARSPEMGNKVFRASANCLTGRITTAQEKSYTLAGVWDNSDIGGGRTKWRGADGRIEPRDNASDGLAIAEQWEVLCPAPVPAQLLAQAARPVAAAPGPAPAAPAVVAASACSGKRYCDEASAFAAIITDFRPSIIDNSTRMVSATVRFLNKTNRALVLGYVRGSGVAIDEQGNRYVVAGPENVRGIGEVGAGRDFDPKFVVPPGQTADARLEFTWRWNGRDIIGQRAWDVDLTVREVGEVAPGQYRLGQEHALQFKAVPGRNAAVSQAAPAMGAPVAPGMAAPAGAAEPVAQSTAMPVASPLPDACGGRQRCYDAGPFVAEIAQLTLAREGTSIQNRMARLNIRFRNKTNTPLVLGYVAKTSVLVDNFGQRYFWGRGYDTSVTGMGLVEGTKADTQFVLAPGETRSATFTLYRPRPPKTDPDGTGFTYDVTIAQLEVLYNGQQVRTLRQHTMTFPDFAPNGPGGLGSGGGVNGAASQTLAPAQSIKEATDALRGIFKKK